MEIHPLEARRDWWYFKLNQIVDKNVTENIFFYEEYVNLYPNSRKMVEMRSNIKIKNKYFHTCFITLLCMFYT